jgi:hypothetical protein
MYYDSYHYTHNTLPKRQAGKLEMEIYNMTFQPPNPQILLTDPNKRKSQQYHPVQTHDIPRLLVAGILYRAPWYVLNRRSRRLEDSFCLSSCMVRIYN